MMRTIKTTRGYVFVVAHVREVLRLQKDKSWKPVEELTVRICAAREQDAINSCGFMRVDADGNELVDNPGDTLGYGVCYRSEIEKGRDDVKAMKKAFARAVSDFSGNPDDRKRLWKAFLKG